MDLIPTKIFSSLSVNTLYSAFLAEYDPNFYFPGECHDCWELDCTISGRSGVTSGEHVYECEPYELVIHAPNVFHTAWTRGTEALTELTISFALKGPEHLIPKGKFILNDVERFYMDRLREIIPRLFLYTKDTVVNPIRIQEGTTLANIQYFKNILELLILSLGQRNEKAAQPAAGKEAKLFTAIARYMNEHVCDALNIDAICDTFGISRSTVKELFRRFTGGGVMDYYHYLRINHAVSLMDTGLSMAEISRVMNFSTQNYFSAFFKRETGVAPREYQKSRSEQDR